MAEVADREVKKGVESFRPDSNILELFPRIINSTRIPLQIKGYGIDRRHEEVKLNIVDLLHNLLPVGQGLWDALLSTLWFLRFPSTVVALLVSRTPVLLLFLIDLLFLIHLLLPIGLFLLIGLLLLIGRLSLLGFFLLLLLLLLEIKNEEDLHEGGEKLPHGLV